MDLDDILNDALEEVTRDEEQETSKPKASEDVKSALSSAAATTAKVQEENAQIAASAEPPPGEEGDLANLLKMFGAGSDFEKILDDAFKDLDINELMSKMGVPPGEGGEGPQSEEAEMERLMKLLSGAGLGGEGAPGAGTDPNMLDPKVLEQLASKLEQSMGGDQMNKMFESMMKSVMSKDLMYEPVKAITEEYPKILSQKGIPSEDRSRFEQQYSAYKALRVTFEQEGDTNMEKVMQIIQDLERFGQPPAEISKLLGSGAAPPGFPAGGPNPNTCPTQ